VTVYEAGEDAGRLFVSMRFVDGANLRQLLDVEGPMAPERAVALLAQVAAALDAAHGAGLVHRDVKPANILIERRAEGDHASLADFGLVKRMGADAELTGDAGWVGTVDYVAPEQVAGGVVDARTDIYALGAVLYTALSGLVPYPRDDTAAKLYASVNEPIPALHPGRREVPAGLDAVIARATAKDPNRRYARAGDLAADAAAAMSATTSPLPAGVPRAADWSIGATRPLAGPRPATRRRPKRMALAIVAALAVLAGGVGIAVAVAGGSGRPRPAVSGRAGAPPVSPAPTSGAQPSAPPVSRAGGAISVEAVDFGTLHADTYHLEIYDLVRSGPFVTLDFSFACTTTAGCHQYGDFASPDIRSLSTGGGIRLIDRAAKKEYPAVTDGRGRPNASMFPGQDVSKGDPPVYGWVKFPLPPASVSAMDVVFPNGGPQITAAPVTSGPSRFPAGVQAPGPAPFDTPPGSTDTAGLSLRTYDLITTIGNPTGSQAQSPAKETVTLSADVLFAFGESTLAAEAAKVLAQVGGGIKGSGTGVVTINGYTDSIGPDSVNIPLSQARAQSVAAALTPLAAGAPVSFQTLGNGSASPVAPNMGPNGSDNPAGRALNRRVTIAYATTKETPQTPLPAAAPAPAAAPGPRTVSFTENSAGTINGTSTYQATVNRLTRSGPFAVLELTVRCQTSTATGTKPASCKTINDLGASNSVPPTPIDQDVSGVTIGQHRVNAIYLADSTGNDYVAVRDINDDPLTAIVGTDIVVDDSHPLWIYFPAPPASTTSMTVVLPGDAARVTGVPITDGS